MPAKPRARNFPPRPTPRRRELSYLIAALLASGGAAQYAAAREVPFAEPPAISTTANGGGSVIAADGDGDQDALAASFNNHSVAWFENDGTGTTWTATNISTAITQAQAVFTADLDGDGDADVLAASYDNDAVTWHENGPGGTWTAHTVSGSVDGAVDVVAADVDRDGDLDVIAASRFGAFVAWYENDGAGGTWSSETIAAALPGANSVMASDVDGDGDLDVLTTASGSDLIAWHENDGTGSPWPLHTISNLPDNPGSVFAGDVDRDGDVDVLSTSINDGLVAWHENDGTALGWTLRTVAVTTAAPTSGRLADLDGDGDLDVYVADIVGDALVWFENTTDDGSAWLAHTVTTSADGARAVVAADFDDDGNLDLLGASFNDDGIRLYRNGGGQFGLPTLDIVVESLADNSETLPLLDIQALHLGRSGDSDAELATLEVLLTDGGGTPLTSFQANALIEDLEVWLDDGSGVFEAGPDTLVHTDSSFSLTTGVQTVTFSDGNGNFQLPFSTPRVYFVVAVLTADADSQTPSSFQATHVTESSSTGEDAAADIPLTLEYWPDTGTGLIMTSLDSANCQTPAELLLSNRTVTTTVACEAGTFIRAGDSFVVGSGGDLSLRAGETIRFTSGFHVDEGTLSVTIEPALQP